MMKHKSSIVIIILFVTSVLLFASSIIVYSKQAHLSKIYKNEIVEGSTGLSANKYIEITLRLNDIERDVVYEINSNDIRKGELRNILLEKVKQFRDANDPRLSTRGVRIYSPDSLLDNTKIVKAKRELIEMCERPPLGICVFELGYWK